MGLLEKRDPCIFCGGKVKGLLPWKLEGHPVCNECYGEVDVQADLSLETVDTFKKYMEFRTENKRLAEKFHIDYELKTGLLQNNPVFDFSNQMFCFSKHLNKTIFCAGDAIEFTIAEDQNVIFRGRAKGLEQFESYVPQRVQEMQPLIDRVAVEIQEYECMEEMTRRMDQQAREQNREPVSRPILQRPEVPRPFQQFVIIISFNHPYWKEKQIEIKGPDFSYNRPNAYEYMESYQRAYSEILELANALARTLFPEARLIEDTGASTQATGGNDAIEQLREYKKLMDDGIISQEEFDAKKKQIMGI